MNASTLRHDLQVLMRALAAQDYKRRHPGASEAAAWAHAERHCGRYRAQAVTALTLLVLDAETAQVARAREN